MIEPKIPIYHGFYLNKKNTNINIICLNTQKCAWASRLLRDVGRHRTDRT